MQLIHKLLDYSLKWSLPHVAIFTGNPVTRRDGAIVMGRGAAKQVRDTYPNVQYALGEIIKPEDYLVFVPIDNTNVHTPSEQFIGWFKVKNHWQQPAELELITLSTKALYDLAIKHQDMSFHMNYPGIGNGKLTVDDVGGILSILPDNVFIYK